MSLTFFGVTPKKYYMNYSTILFKTLLLFLCCAFVISSLSGCANRNYKKVFVYGFGTMQVPRTATVAEIDDMVHQQYGSNLFWSPR